MQRITIECYGFPHAQFMGLRDNLTELVVSKKIKEDIIFCEENHKVEDSQKEHRSFIRILATQESFFEIVINALKSIPRSEEIECVLIAKYLKIEKSIDI